MRHPPAHPAAPPDTTEWLSLVGSVPLPSCSPEFVAMWGCGHGGVSEVSSERGPNEHAGGTGPPEAVRSTGPPAGPEGRSIGGTRKAA